MKRTYTASVVPTRRTVGHFDANVEVMLMDADFAVDEYSSPFNVFVGQIVGNVVMLKLGEGPGNTIMERLTPTTTLEIIGVGSGSVDPPNMTGVIKGSLTVEQRDVNGTITQILGRCTGDLRFIFDRAAPVISSSGLHQLNLRNFDASTR